MGSGMRSGSIDCRRIDWMTSSRALAVDTIAGSDKRRGIEQKLATAAGEAAARRASSAGCPSRQPGAGNGRPGSPAPLLNAGCSNGRPCRVTKNTPPSTTESAIAGKDGPVSPVAASGKSQVSRTGVSSRSRAITDVCFSGSLPCGRESSARVNVTGTNNTWFDVLFHSESPFLRLLPAVRVGLVEIAGGRKSARRAAALAIVKGGTTGTLCRSLPWRASP